MALKTNEEEIREDQNLTGLSMPFFNSNIFFTQTFSNVKHKGCLECQEQWLLSGNKNYLAQDLKHNHFPSYTYILKCLRDIATYFDPELSQFVVEGSPNFLKKIESYADEHKLRGVFSYKDNTRVTRPHIHGFVKYVNIKHFKQILYRSKLFIDEYNDPCKCYYKEIVNGNWVYKLREGEEIRPKYAFVTYHGSEPCNPPRIIRVPVGYHDYQPIKDDLNVQKYIQKYLQKDGCEGRIG